MKLVGYARVSGEAQKENTSLPQQRKEIEEYCNKQGYELIAFYQDVQSGGTIDKRDGFQWALKTVYSVADGLIFYRLDRFSRKVLDAERIKEEFQTRGKELLSVMDTCDMKTEDGEFIFTINSAIAELERKRIRARCKKGLEKKKEAGGWCGGRTPYGYKSYQKTLIELPHEQEVIRYIRRLYYLEYYNYSKIARKLNELGVPAKGKKGWNENTIKRIIFSEPQSVITLKKSGKLLPASHWKKITQTDIQGLQDAEIPRGLIG